MSDNPTYCVTSSLDGSIKIFCLEMMIELYSFQVSESESCKTNGMENIQLIDDRIYAIFTGGHQTAIEVGTVSHLVSSFYISKPIVNSIIKGYRTY